MVRSGCLQRGSFPLAILCFVSLLFYTGNFIRIPLVPLYASEFGASTLQIGIVMSSFMVLAAALSFPMGYLSDRVGRLPLVVLGMCLSAASSALLLITSDVTQVTLVYALAGVGSGMTSPALSALIGDISRSSAMARSYGWFSTSLHVGTTGGPAIGGIVAGLWGYHSAFIWAALIGGLAIALALLFVREPEHPPVDLKQTNKSRGGFRILNLNSLVYLGWLSTFTYAFSIGVVHPFFPIYATENGLSLEAVGALFAVQSLFNAVTRIPIGYISDRLGMRVPFIIIGMAFLALGTAACVSTVNVVYLAAIFAVLGISTGAVGMAISTTIAESTNAGTRGMAMGGQSTARYAGRASSPLMVGAVLPASGYFISFFMAAAVCGVGAISYMALWRKKMGNKSRNSNV